MDELRPEHARIKDLRELASIDNLDDLLDYAWLELGDVRNLKYTNPLSSKEWKKDNNIPLLVAKLCKDINYIHFFVKYFLEIDLLPFQVVILKQLWNKPFPMLICTRGGSKTFMLAVYIITRMILDPGCKIAVVGASLRQSMQIYTYIETIFESAPVLQDICGGKKHGPKRDLHICYWKVGKSSAVFLPLGNGEKIRGQRATIIIVDEFSSVSREVFETVVRGFASVKSQGVHNSVVEAYKKKILQDLGVEIELVADSTEKAFSGNQIILSGTMSFNFNHFYTYWRYYKSIILSGGDQKILQKEFPDMTIMNNINPADYCVLRIPYDKIPAGMMDEAILTQGQTTMDPAIFKQEYGCCLYEDCEILTANGIRKIKDIRIGDLVLTHKGRFRKVTKKTYRYVNEDLISIDNYGYYKNIKCTQDHPFWNLSNDFILAKDVENYSYLSNLKELNNLNNIDLRDYVSDYLEYEDCIYAKPSPSTFTNIEIQDIRTSTLTINALAQKYGCSYHKIWSVKNDKCIPKFSIPHNITLDYDFGIILGYYLSEGSLSAKDRAINFSLDGHIDVPLSDFVQELEKAIYNVFGIKAKKYAKKSGVIDVTINSRLLAEFFKRICPGDCYTKTIDPNLLYSNADFMKGIIKGYWNGDGYKGKHVARACSTSKDLLSQIKLVLSYFKIGSSISKRKATTYNIEDRMGVCSPAYDLNVSGLSLVNFMKLYDINFDGRRSNYIIPYEGYCQHKISSKELIPYNGLVYNLEVDEDESYSLPCATIHNCSNVDSEGFYLASWLFKATCPVKMEGNKFLTFNARMGGDHNKVYIMGIDPASEDDLFTVNIIELNSTYRGIVYQWSTNRQQYEEMKRNGLISDRIDDYNTFVITHLRHLLRRFNIQLMVMDTGGGGLSMKELLRDKDKLLDESDHLIFDREDENCRGLKGRHILQMIEFSSYEWRTTSHWGLRQDLLDMKILFPEYNIPEVVESSLNDIKAGRFIDTLEDCYQEIEQCKVETTMIKHSQTPIGQEKWDVPELVGIGADNKKKRLKKDRFTSLLLSNWGCRLYEEENNINLQYDGVGGIAKQISKQDVGGLPYVGAGAAKLVNLHGNVLISPQSVDYPTSSPVSRKIFY